MDYGVTKIIVQFFCFFLFSISYVLLINIFITGNTPEDLTFIPGTLIVGILGYILGGHIYDILFKD